MYNDGDNERQAHHPIRTTDRPLSAADKALMATPTAQALATRYPSWGPERIRAELRRTGA